MSTTIKLKRSSVPGRVPTTSQLELGEIAINTADGKLYFKKYDSVANTESIIDVSADLDADAILSLLNGVDGANSGLDADLLDGQEGEYYLDFTNFTNLPDPTITVDGDVEGSVTLTDLASANLTLELTDTGVTPGSYGSASQIPIVTVDVDGRITAMSNTAVAGVDDFTWDAANNQLQLTTGDGSVYNIYLNEFKDLTVEDLNANTINITSFTFDALDVGGDISANNIIVDGLVDGRDIAADGAKLDRIEEDLTVTLTGDVTGTVTSNNGTMSVATDIANSGVTAGTYGSATAIPVITIDLDGRISLANTTPVAGVDNFTYDAANNTITLETGDGSIFHVQTETEVTLTGDVTGTATATDGNISIAADIANSGVTAGTYGSSSQIPIVTVGLDGRITSMSNTAVAGVDNVTWAAANSTLSIATGDGSVYNTVIDTFDNITVTDSVAITETLSANNALFRGNAQINGSLTVLGESDVTQTASAGDVSANNANLTGDVNFRTGNSSVFDTIKLTTETPTSDQVITLPDVTGTVLTTGNANTLLTTLLTVDGNGSGLDADTVDGYSAQEILDASANNAAALVGTADITLEGNTGLTGSGTFNVNTANNQTIVITHADTSSVSDASLADGNVLTGLTFDTFGHVQTTSSTDLDGRYYTEAELDAGQLDNRYYTETEVGTLFVPQTTEVLAGTGLAGGGALSANVTLTHGDTSSQANVSSDNADGTVIQDFTLNVDDFGHVIGVTVGTTDLDGRYYTETETDTLLNAKADKTINIIAGDGLTGGGTLGANVTVSHDDTSSVANTGAMDLANSEVISSLTFDEFGHVTAFTTGNLDTLTQAQADALYVNVTGDTMSGALTVNANINQQHATYGTAQSTTTTTAQTLIYAFPYANYGSGEFVITAQDGSNRHVTKLLVTHNGSTAIATEYGSVWTSSELADFEVAISGPQLNIYATPASTNSTTFTTVATLTKV